MNTTGKQELAANSGLNGKVVGSAAYAAASPPIQRQDNRQVEFPPLKEELQLMSDALAAARAEVRTLSEYLVLAQEEERRRIARELHDDISQRTAVIEFELDRVAPLLRDPDGTAALSSARLGLAKLSAAIRHISHQLHPAIVTDLGLQSALRQLVDDFNKAGGVAMLTLNDRIAEPIFDPLLGTALYRIAQEALQNVRKHAGDGHVRIRLYRNDSVIRLSIKDSGPGFVVETSGAHRGLGLLSMRERARLIGATLMVRSRPGEGTHIVVSLNCGQINQSCSS